MYVHRSISSVCLQFLITRAADHSTYICTCAVIAVLLSAVRMPLLPGQPSRVPTLTRMLTQPCAYIVKSRLKPGSCFG